MWLYFTFNFLCYFNNLFLYSINRHWGRIWLFPPSRRHTSGMDGNIWHPQCTLRFIGSLPGCEVKYCFHCFLQLEKFWFESKNTSGLSFNWDVLSSQKPRVKLSPPCAPGRCQRVSWACAFMQFRVQFFLACLCQRTLHEACEESQPLIRARCPSDAQVWPCGCVS